ncbi:MAG: hypothetical protein J0H98_08485 [Solirubrobacterales bacterium]|nr:hypothetical protein [Solirubrobacterales bacterium]
MADPTNDPSWTAPEGDDPAGSGAPEVRRRFGLDLGNPVERETAAFSWLIVVIIAAVTVGLVGKLISPLAAVIWVIVLLGIVSVPIFKGLRHQLGSPEDD